MPRESYDRELQRLQDEVLALGSMVENALTEAVELLKRRDLEGSRRLIAADNEINRRRFALESDALVLIATQQPMARDLRVIAAVLEVATELERIGDYAKGIARINLMIGPGPLVKPLIDIPAMAQRARAMLHEALDAFVRQDVEKAKAIPAQDEEVDALYNQVYRELMAIILSNPSAIDQANYLLWAAHNLERAADRVTNICERVVFTVTGRMEEMDSEDAQSVESLG
jgi:phosphate transport system protein